MKVIFDIFDTDNDELFGLDDLITVLRTFEKNQVIPNLVKAAHKTKNITSSDENTDADSKSSKSIGTQESLEDGVSSVSKAFTSLSSKKLKKVAKQMFKNAGFNKNASLDLNDFTEFINNYPAFLKSMQKAMRPDVWIYSSQSKIIQAPAEFSTNESDS